MTAMETWFFIVTSFSIAALLKAFLNLFFLSKNPIISLPPHPLSFIDSILWLNKSSFWNFSSVIHSFHVKFGSLVTLRIGAKHHIYVADGHLAHQALVQNGAILSSRPPPTNTNRIISRNQHTISSASYSPTWHLLRLNLISEMLHPSVVKSFSKALKWALQILIDRLVLKSNVDCNIINFQHGMFCLLFFMCFGYKLDQKQMEEIDRLQHSNSAASRSTRFDILNILPLGLSKIVFRRRWSEFLQLRKNLQDAFVPLIRTRKEVKELRSGDGNKEDEFILSYVDTLLNLQLPDEKRKLNEEELVNLCEEFFTGGAEILGRRYYGLWRIW